MGLINSAALGLFALAIPIIIFYMLRLRRQPVKVSSLLLWRRVLQDHQANAPWQRLRRNLLLLLQLLLLALIALALARPYRLVEAKVQGSVILLLDASASMQATDVSPSRFEVAKAEAIDIIRALEPGDTVSLIRVSDMPQPLLTGDAAADRAALEKAIIEAQPTNVSANWESALALAAAGATSRPSTSVVILSDGAALPDDLLALPAPVRWISIGKGNNNQAIVALAARDGHSGPELFVRVMNFSNEPVERLLEIKVDGQLFDARSLDLPAYPAGDIGLTIANLPPNAGLIQTNLAQNDDLLLDNSAQTRRAGLEGRVLLVGPGNLFLERAFSLLPGLTVFQAAPDNLPAEQTFDLTVFDRTAPKALPGNLGSLLFIAPPASSPLFKAEGIFTNTRQSGPIADDHPILTYVDFSNLHVSEAQKMKPPLWAKTLLNSQGGPLLMAGAQDGRRVAIIAFDLLKSDLPLQIDFPILTANLSRWLLGQSIIVEVENKASAGFQLINPLDAGESNIRPNQSQIRGTGQAAVQTRLERSREGDILQGRQEFWLLLLALALAVLFWEWWVYWRGGSA